MRSEDGSLVLGDEGSFVGAREGSNGDLVLESRRAILDKLADSVYVRKGVLYGLIAAVIVLAFIALVEGIILLSVTGGSTTTITNNTSSDDCMPGSFTIPCNGHGAKYEPDGSCECWACFSGADCSTQIPEDQCILDASSAQPFMMEDYWFDNRNVPGPNHISIDYRVAYQSNATLWPDPLPSTFTNQLTRELNTLIRRVHAKYGNAVTEGRSIVIGTGARTLTAAALYALSVVYNTSFTHYAQTPYFTAYPRLCALFPDKCTWNDSDEIPSGTPIWEIVTTPNNPDGEDREPYYGTSSNTWAYSLVYYWPHYVSEIEKKDAPIMLFSLSKMTGHAASRFGWAIVRDPLVAEKMEDWVEETTRHTSIDSAKRALHILQYINSTGGDDFFSSIRSELSRRWTKLQDVFLNEQDFELVSTTGSAFAWIRCPADMAENRCYEVFESVGLKGWKGRLMGVRTAPFHYRLSLSLHSSSYDIALAKLARALQQYHAGRRSTARASMLQRRPEEMERDY